MVPVPDNPTEVRPVLLRMPPDKRTVPLAADPPPISKLSKAAGPPRTVWVPPEIWSMPRPVFPTISKPVESTLVVWLSVTSFPAGASIVSWKTDVLVARTVASYVMVMLIFVPGTRETKSLGPGTPAGDQSVETLQAAEPSAQVLVAAAASGAGRAA
jgi:hypothetical protein